jgi:hypothetical protein
VWGCIASPWKDVDHSWKKTAWHSRQLSEPASRTGSSAVGGGTEVDGTPPPAGRRTQAATPRQAIAAKTARILRFSGDGAIAAEASTQGLLAEWAIRLM